MQCVNISCWKRKWSSFPTGRQKAQQGQIRSWSQIRQAGKCTMESKKLLNRIGILWNIFISFEVDGMPARENITRNRIKSHIGHFKLARMDRNLQVRFCLKVVLDFWEYKFFGTIHWLNLDLQKTKKERKMENKVRKCLAWILSTLIETSVLWTYFILCTY